MLLLCKSNKLSPAFWDTVKAVATQWEKIKVPFARCFDFICELSAAESSRQN